MDNTRQFILDEIEQHIKDLSRDIHLGQVKEVKREGEVLMWIHVDIDGEIYHIGVSIIKHPSGYRHADK